MSRTPATPEGGMSDREMLRSALLQIKELRYEVRQSNYSHRELMDQIRGMQTVMSHMMSEIQAYREALRDGQ